ncbi:hypothetical protein ACFP3U_30360 [Kitasatospora misakiensis]|uniref:Integral membrane protein n=1 Tax=Kitasatospora misakiensis TaxID=67330 RepID=A0ABW0X9N3_9ACTN
MYAREPAPAAPPRRPVPPRPAGPPSGGAPDGSAGAFLPAPARSDRGAGRDGGSPWTAKPVDDAPADPEALPPAYRAVSMGDWDYVTIDFGDGPIASNRPIPDQRSATEPGAEPGPEPGTAADDPATAGDAAADTADTADTAGKGKGKGKGKSKGRGRKAARAQAQAQARGKGGPPASAPADGAPDAAGGPAKPGSAGGRRPSFLLLLSAAVLIGGAVTGQLIAMLIGWALGYLSRHLSDFTRKLAVFGIPLMVISGSSLWYWGRAQGRWGAAPQPGEQGSHAMWEAAPGVLRVAAVLSAVFLLLMSLRRKGGGTA